MKMGKDWFIKKNDRRKVFVLLFSALVLLLCLSSVAEEEQEEPVPLYRAVVSSSGRILDRPDGETVQYVRKGYLVDIYSVDPKYLYVSCYNQVGYLLRDRVETVYAVDSVSTPPYGVEIFSYLTTAGKDLPIWPAPAEEGDPLITLHEGASFGIIGFENGWAKVIFKRQYGYVRGDWLDSLIQVRGGTDEDLLDAPLSVYTSYYNLADTPANRNRIVNLNVACQRLENIVLDPGERLDFNKQVGPYKASVGYQSAPVLAGGTTTLNYGGGTCQVASTLYNAVLQLPGLTVTRRRAHGPSGASYVPHGVDAAVGSGNINLIFRNDYDFPIRFEAVAQDGALTINIWKAETLSDSGEK